MKILTLLLSALALGGCITLSDDLLTDGGAGGVAIDGGTGGAGGSELLCDGQPEASCDDATCQWTGVRCVDRARQCEGLEADACEVNACFWWGDGTCHTTGDPTRCDQPDPMSCENAGCEWGPEGCGGVGTGPIECPALSSAACLADGRCLLIEEEICNEWDTAPAQEPGGAGAPMEPPPCAVVQRCVYAPVACGDLDPRTCADRVDCVWRGQSAPTESFCECGTPGCDCGDADGGAMLEGVCVAQEVSCEMLSVAACGDTADCHVVYYDTPCAQPEDGDAICEPVPVCEAIGPSSCEGLDEMTCRSFEHCASYLMDTCGSPKAAAGAEMPAVPCDMLACGLALEVCPTLQEPACQQATGCTPLRTPIETFIGCWTDDDCSLLDPDRCEAHPRCTPWLPEAHCEDGDADCYAEGPFCFPG